VTPRCGERSGTYVDRSGPSAPSARSVGSPRLVHLLDRPYLDTSRARGRNLRGKLDGLVQVAGVDQDEPPDLLFRLDERTVGGERHAVVDAQRGRGLDGQIDGSG
jgi:hypothetical protein